MPAGRTFVVAVCAAATAGVALTGCDDGNDKGSGPILVPAATTSAKAEPFADMTASQLLTKAEQDMRDAGAMTYDISLTEDGTALRVKASITSDGGCAAAMEVDGGKAQFIVPGGPDAYLKGDEDFWEDNTDANAARLFADKWVKMPASEFGGSDLGGMCDLDALMDSITEGDEADGTSVTKGEPTTLDGKQVVPLFQTDADDDTVTIDISTGATPYVVRSVQSGGDEPGVATFSDFGKKPHITPPPRAETVDPKDLAPGTLHI